MSNLAKTLQQEVQQSSQKTSVPHKQAAPKKFTWFSPGEKILILALGVMLTTGAGFILAKQAEIYEVNKEIQLVEQSIQDQRTINSDLEIQISELSRYERIKEHAERQGLSFNENNIKAVQ